MAASIVLTVTTLCLATLIATIDVLASNDVYSKTGGFSIELINRDSPNSPFYNPDQTPTQHLANAFRRSMNRINQFSPTSSSLISPTTAESEIISNQGEYLMEISIGTPPFEIFAIADTGSDLIWTQCRPCTNCYQQDAPLFDPEKSTTYRDLSCSARQCSLLEDTSCSSVGRNGICQYRYSYGDRSFTRGNVAAETITLGSTTRRPVQVPKALFGCGHNNGGTFSAKGSGIVGLGGGPVSLISQLGSTIAGKFSYCLVPYSSRTTNSSKLNFGSNGVVSGEGVESTPLIFNNPDTFYFLKLEAISVGNERITFRGSSFGTNEGNIIIDSGTTLTLVPSEFFSEIASAVDRVIGGQQIDDPSGVLNLCYSSESDVNFPTITAHFDGADVKLKSLNAFIQVADGVVCFAFNPIDNGAIFGNLAQMNFLVGYDLEAKTVSFKPTDCTKE